MCKDTHSWLVVLVPCHGGLAVPQPHHCRPSHHPLHGQPLEVPGTHSVPSGSVHLNGRGGDGRRKRHTWSEQKIQYYVATKLCTAGYMYKRIYQYIVYSWMHVQTYIPVVYSWRYVQTHIPRVYSWRALVFTTVGSSEGSVN